MGPHASATPTYFPKELNPITKILMTNTICPPIKSNQGTKCHNYTKQFTQLLNCFYQLGHFPKH